MFLPKLQQGATLIVSLVMLLVLLVLGTSLAGIAQMSEKAAHNKSNKQVAFHSAESALTDAEIDIENNVNTNSRSKLFSRYATEGFIKNCASGEDNVYQGLCTYETGHNTAWRRADIASTSSNSPSVQFGHFTGNTIPNGTGSFSALLPRYIIELLPDTIDAQSTDSTFIYRITAIGFGRSSSTQIVLQSFYRKMTHPASNDASTLPKGRLSWREISNWHDLKK
jgi:type IV pilus assembly protein PilX